jgi:hypothetical protein
MALAVELLILLFLSLTEDALDQKLGQAHLIASLARRMSALGPEKTATFFEFPDPAGGELWLEDLSGHVLQGHPNPSLTWGHRLTLTAKKTVYSDLTVFETPELTLTRTPVYLAGQKLYLFQTQKDFWRLTKGDHFVQGFVSLVIVSSVMSLLALKKALKPLSSLQNDLVPLTNGDLSGRVIVSGEGVIPKIAQGVNQLAQAMAKREEDLEALDLVIAQSRAILANSRVSAGLVEEALLTGAKTAGQGHLVSLGASLSRLDRLLAEILLIHKLAKGGESFRQEKLSLSALAFEVFVRYQEIAGSQALVSKVTSELYIQGNYELTQILITRLLDQALALTRDYPVVLALEKTNGQMVLSAELKNRDLFLDELEGLFYLKPPKGAEIDPGLALVREIAAFSGAKIQTRRLKSSPSLIIAVLFPDVGYRKGSKLNPQSKL